MKDPDDLEERIEGKDRSPQERRLVLGLFFLLVTGFLIFLLIYHLVCLGI